MNITITLERVSTSFYRIREIEGATKVYSVKDITWQRTYHSIPAELLVEHRVGDRLTADQIDSLPYAPYGYRLKLMEAGRLAF